LPPAARGALFEKTAPLDPLQKLLIKGGHDLQLKRIYANHDRLWFFTFFLDFYLSLLYKLTIKSFDNII
jgi:hypothetical protein